MSLLFVVDISFDALQNGILHSTIHALHLLLSHWKTLEESERPLVGLVTFNDNVHFYNLSSRLSTAQMMVMTDPTDVFLPFFGGFVDPVDSMEIIQELLGQLPKMFPMTAQPKKACVGSAIKAGHLALQTRGGRMLVLTANTVETGLGAFKVRHDNPKALDTEAFTSQNKFFQTLGEEACTDGIGIDLFILSKSGNVGISTIGTVSKLTGGDVFNYGPPSGRQSLNAEVERLIRDVVAVVKRNTVFEALMRIRCSLGLTAGDHHGSFFMRNATDMEFGVVDETHSVAVEILHEDKIGETNAYFQGAMLFTRKDGVRVVRVMNIAVSVVREMSDSFKSADIDCIMNYLCKAYASKVATVAIADLRKQLTKTGVNILSAYSKHCYTDSSSTGQLILPESFKLLPVYMLGLLKSPLLDEHPSGVPLHRSLDDRAAAVLMASHMSLMVSIPFIYSRMFALHELSKSDKGIEAPLVRASYERLSASGVYLVENGYVAVIWVGPDVAGEILDDVFGASSFQMFQSSLGPLPVRETILSSKYRQVISYAQSERGRVFRIITVKKGDPTEAYMFGMMTEDMRSKDTPSYPDYLCAVHRAIQDS